MRVTGTTSSGDFLRYNHDFQNQKVKEIFKPGACLVSYGRKGGGKTHCAISFAQKLVQGEFPDMPKHVFLLSNILFVRNDGSPRPPEAYPPNVYKITTLKDYFSIVADLLEKYDRSELLILMVLDEAQNFLLGDMNSSGDFAKSFKTFAGLFRKFNTVAWFITPAMRNLTPAFRNFIDADTDAGNVTCTFQKNTEKSAAFLKRKHMDGDPRDIVYVKTGADIPVKMLVVPTSSWTRDPHTIPIGEYAYDTFSSADFRIGNFPFYDFLFYISGRTSFDMVPSIREFYRKMEQGEVGEAPVDKEKVERELTLRIIRNADMNGINNRTLEKLLECDVNRVNYLKRLARAKYPEMGRRKGGSAASDDSTKPEQASTDVEC